MGTILFSVPFVLLTILAVLMVAGIKRVAGPERASTVLRVIRFGSLAIAFAFLTATVWRT